jgi:hypothetical protein
MMPSGASTGHGGHARVQLRRDNVPWLKFHGQVSEEDEHACQIGIMKLNKQKARMCPIVNRLSMGWLLFFPLWMLWGAATYGGQARAGNSNERTYDSERQLETDELRFASHRFYGRRSMRETASLVSTSRPIGRPRL